MPVQCHTISRTNAEPIPSANMPLGSRCANVNIVVECNHYIHISTSVSSLTCSSSTTKTPFKLAFLCNKTIADAHPSFIFGEAILLTCMWDSRVSIRVYQDDVGQPCWNQCFAGINSLRPSDAYMRQ